MYFGGRGAGARVGLTQLVVGHLRSQLSKIMSCFDCGQVYHFRDMLVIVVLADFSTDDCFCGNIHYKFPPPTDEFHFLAALQFFLILYSGRFLSSKNPYTPYLFLATEQRQCYFFLTT